MIHLYTLSKNKAGTASYPRQAAGKKDLEKILDQMFNTLNIH